MYSSIYNVFALVCEVIRYRLVQVRQNLKKKRLLGLAAHDRLFLPLPLSFSSSSYFLSFSKQKWNLVDGVCANTSQFTWNHHPAQSFPEQRMGGKLKWLPWSQCAEAPWSSMCGSHLCGCLLSNSDLQSRYRQHIKCVCLYNGIWTIFLSEISLLGRVLKTSCMHWV